MNRRLRDKKSRGRDFSCHDRFKVPMPVSKGVCGFHEPYIRRGEPASPWKGLGVGDSQARPSEGFWLLTGKALLFWKG